MNVTHKSRKLQYEALEEQAANDIPFLLHEQFQFIELFRRSVNRINIWYIYIHNTIYIESASITRYRITPKDALIYNQFNIIVIYRRILTKTILIGGYLL